MATNKHRARVRMYRVGLGDCFLLTVFEEEKPRHMLIDCGMFAGSRLDPAVVEKDLKNEIVNDIATETGGHLDVVVVTHEHMDHVSIFNSAKKVFDEKLTFGEAWFGWVEDLSNPAARQLRQKYEALEAEVSEALAGLSALAADDSE